ncbi:MAG: hypothetical protein WCZ89_08915 [Phycisphaerae bacterium]
MNRQNLSKYQKDVISSYYSNLDSIMLNKVSELVTELYLADNDAKRKKLWQRVQKAMVQLKIPAAIVEHIIQKQDVEILAKNLKEWHSRKPSR